MLASSHSSSSSSSLKRFFSSRLRFGVSLLIIILILNLLFFNLFSAYFLKSRPSSSPVASRAANPSNAEAEQQIREFQTKLAENTAELQHLKERILNSPPAASVAVSPVPVVSSSSSLPYLIIGIPTVSRKNHTDYLSGTLTSISSQLSVDPRDPMFRSVSIWVMDNTKLGGGAGADNEPHSAFRKAKETFSSHPCQCFRFLENDGSLSDAHPSSRDPGSPNVPGWRVRKQTRDIVRLAQLAQDRSSYYLFMEDDFHWCPRTMEFLHYFIEKANRRLADQWISIKLSFGMNGFLVRNGGDLAHFSAYLLKHQARRPPDHLIAEWSAGETAESAAQKSGRPNLVSRFNLLHHKGTKSSLREQDQGEYALCYHEMNTEILFEVEAFKFPECPNDDLSPCEQDKEQQSTLSIPHELILKHNQS